jgi:hypothetical protein
VEVCEDDDDDDHMTPLLIFLGSSVPNHNLMHDQVSLLVHMCRCSDLSLLDPSQPPTADQVARAAAEASTAGSGGVVELPAGRELLRKTISVNDPFRYGGVTMYQVTEIVCLG